MCGWVGRGSTIVVPATGPSDEDERIKRVCWWSHAPVYDLS